VESFSATLLVGGGGNQLIWKLFSSSKDKYEEEKGSPHACARSPRLIGWGGAKGAGARHLREWSTKIQLLVLRERSLLLQF
jgi:hypothetical protein